MTGFFNQKNTLLLNHSIQSKHKNQNCRSALYHYKPLMRALATSSNEEIEFSFNNFSSTINLNKPTNVQLQINEM
jgi:hypothetical protein